MNAANSWHLLKRNLLEWDLGQTNAHAAAISYFAVFSLAPLLLVSIAIASLFFGRTEAEETLIAQLQYSTDDRVVTIVQEILAERRPVAVDGLATGAGVLILIYSGSAVFLQLQRAIRAEWGLMATSRPIRESLLAFLRNRLWAGLVVMTVGGTLLLIMLLNTAWRAVPDKWRTEWLSGAPFLSSPLLQWTISMLLALAIFGLVFKWLAPVRLQWRGVWVGAAVTAVLFWLGNEVIWLLLATPRLHNVYGTTGSFVAFLAWIYYLAWIVLFGARITYVYAREAGALG